MTNDQKRDVAEILTLKMEQAVSASEIAGIGLEVDAVYDRVVQRFIASAVAEFHGIVDHTVRFSEKWPKDWWQAFKERWFPRWALRRWPVEHKTIEIDQKIYSAICPHLKNDVGTKPHLEWMSWQSRRGCPESIDKMYAEILERELALSLNVKRSFEDDEKARAVAAIRVFRTILRDMGLENTAMVPI